MIRTTSIEAKNLMDNGIYGGVYVNPISGLKDYVVWRQNHVDGTWTKTSHTLTARSEKEAQAKVWRRFASCGLSSMSLVAVRAGHTPEKTK